MSTDASMPPEQPIDPEQSMDPIGDPLLEPEQETVSPIVVEIVHVSCWRCGLTTVQAIHCSHCEAVLITEDPKLTRKKTQQNNPRLIAMIVAYVIMLMTSLIYAIALHGDDNRTKADAEAGMVIVEIVDLLITLSLFIFLGRKIVRRPSLRTRILTWSLAPFVGVGMYFLVHAYMEMVRRYVNLDWMHADSDMKFDWFHILIIAVQPALVEELFFRYFAYGTLRQVTHVHSAVVLSALMFALAHLYNPLGLPFLFMMGIMLGYARAYSGGLLLPMLMHFGHNLTVLYMESLK